MSLPADEQSRKAQFDAMLSASANRLEFSQGHNGEKIALHQRAGMTNAPMTAVLEMTVRGTSRERLFFRDRLFEELGVAGTEFSEGRASHLTIRDQKMITTVLEYAAKTQQRMKVSTAIWSALCERVTVSYAGDQKPAMGFVFTEWMRSGAFALSTDAARQLCPADKEQTGNVAALQYYCQHGRNPAEKFSPAY